MMDASSAAVSVSANWPCALFCCGQLGKYTPQVQQQQQQLQLLQQLLHMACNTHLPRHKQAKSNKKRDSNKAIYGRVLFMHRRPQGGGEVKRGATLHTLVAAQLRFLPFPSPPLTSLSAFSFSIQFRFNFNFIAATATKTRRTHAFQMSHSRNLNNFVPKITNTRTCMHIYFYLFNYIYSASIRLQSKFVNVLFSLLLIRFKPKLINKLRKSVSFEIPCKSNVN